jgi:O-antigen/teichoic acid export membrane protein
MGIHEFGLFSLAWMTILFINSLQMAMIISPMLSIGPKQKEGEITGYYEAVIVHQLVFSGLIFVLLLIALSATDLIFPEWQIQRLFLPLAVVAVAFTLQDFLRRYYFAKGKPIKAFYSDVVNYMSRLAVLIWLGQITAVNSDIALWVIAGSSAVAIVIGMLFIDSLSWNAGVFRPVLIRHVRFSKWLIGSALMQWTSGNLFVIAAASLMGASAAGVLKAVQNIMGIMNVIFSGLDNAIPVKASSLYVTRGRSFMFDYLLRLMRWGFFATVGIALLISLKPELWLSLFYGEKYLEYGYLLQGYALLYVLTFLSVLFRIMFRTLEQTRPIFVSYLLATVLSVALAYPFVQWFDFMGVIGGLVFIQTVMVLWYFGAMKREQRVVAYT